MNMKDRLNMKDNINENYRTNEKDRIDDADGRRDGLRQARSDSSKRQTRRLGCPMYPYTVARTSA